MIEYKQSQIARLPVHLIDVVGTPLPGLSYSAVTCDVLKADGTSVNVPLDGAIWVEITAGGWSGLGYYDLVMPASVMGVVGLFRYLVKYGTTSSYAGWVNIVADLESDTMAFVTGKLDVTTGSRAAAATLATFISDVEGASYVPATDNLHEIKNGGTGLTTAEHNAVMKCAALPTDPSSNTVVNAARDNVKTAIMGTDARDLTVLAGPLFDEDTDNLHEIRDAAGGSSGGLTSEEHTALMEADTNSVSIKAKTDNLPSSPASSTQVAAVTSTTAANITNARDSIKGADSRDLTQLAGTGFVSADDSLKQIRDNLASGSGGLTVDEHNAVMEIPGVAAKTTNLPGDPASESNVNSKTAAIKAKTDLIPASPATSAQVAACLQASGYTAPDNADIASIWAAIQDKLDAKVSLTATEAALISAVSSIMGSDVRSISDLAGTGWTTADTMHQVKLEAAKARKFKSNKFIVSKSAATATLFDDDGVTVLAVFDLKDDTGAPNGTQVYQRIPA